MANNPIISASVIDVNAVTLALTGNQNKLIKYFSNAKATMTAQAQGGAVIDTDMYVIRNSGKVGYGTSWIFENIESNEFIFSAQDNKGNVGRKILTPSMVEYIKPTCNIAHNKPDAVGNMTVVCSGAFFNNSFGAVTNTVTAQYRYKKYGGTFGEWQNMSVTYNGNVYMASASFTIPDFSQKQLYSFETRVTDKLTTATSKVYSAKNLPLYHWGEDDFVFEVPVTFKRGATGAESDGDKTVNGSMLVKGNIQLKDGENGNTLYFGDDAYCYVDGDNVMYLKATKLHLLGDSVSVNGNQIAEGTWTPTLNSSAVSSYTTRYGWYSKIGQTVTVGFIIKANCNSGYNGTSISISGLPFTPSLSASGGGMCSGAYVNGGWNFQCFVAETSGNITTRVQACNNTSATNLNTSASGCFYRSGGGELTLSGTITFMTAA